MLSNLLRTTSRNLSTPPVVKVLSLDARDTLITMKESPPIVYSRFARQYDLEVDSDQIMGSFLKNYKRMSIASPCFGFNGIGNKSWWIEVVSSTLLDCAPDSEKGRVEVIAGALYNHYATPEPWKLVESDTRQTLQKLRLKGIILVVISNFDSRLKSLLSQFNLLDLFSMTVLSGEIGYEKPDEKIFQLVVNHFDLISPSEILHIGDNLKNDFHGAKNFGCRALLFDSSSSHNVEPFYCISRL